MAVNYDALAVDYQAFRIPDQRIATKINAHLQGTQSILNVGAGTGSYEPRHSSVVALEPSAEMIARRVNMNSAVIQGTAEQMPFQDNAFDLVMAILTIHHWNDLARGLREMKRVAKHKIVLLTWIDDSPEFWIED